MDSFYRNFINAENNKKSNGLLLTSKVKSLMNEAKENISKGLFEPAVEACLKIVKHDRKSYLGHCILAAAFLGQKNYLSALHNYRKAIEIDETQVIAYEAVGRMFVKYCKDLKEEKDFCKTVYFKMMDLNDENKVKQQEVTLMYLHIFKGMKDPKGVYLTTAYLLTSHNFDIQTAAIKQYVSLEFIKASTDAKIRFENSTVNATIEKTCLYLMTSELSDGAAVEKAWMVHFNLKNRCKNLPTMWKLAMTECPSPYSVFNAERVILMFLESYPTHEVDEIAEHAEALPEDNTVFKLYKSYKLQDIENAISAVSEVLKENKYIIIAYVRLTTLMYIENDYEHAIRTAQTGLELMKAPQAVYHLEYREMVNLLHLALLQTNINYRLSHSNQNKRKKSLMSSQNNHLQTI